MPSGDVACASAHIPPALLSRGRQHRWHQRRSACVGRMQGFGQKPSQHPPLMSKGLLGSFTGRSRRSAMLLARLASSDDQPAQAHLQPRLSRVLAGLSSTQFDAAILAIALPALGSILLDAVMLLIDTAIVGRLGTASLGAVGLSTLLFVFSNLFFNFLTVVTTSNVAGAYAVSDEQEVSRATVRAMVVALVCGVGLSVLLWVYSPWLMTLLGASPEVATLAVMYLRVRCCACPAFLLYNVGTGNFRGRKDTRTPLLAYITTNSIYAVLEIVLVSVLGWGVVGAALAPAIGQYCGLVVMLSLLFRERALLPEHFTTPPSLASIMPLLRSPLMAQAGVPLGAVNLLVVPVVIGCTSLVTALGVASLAAHTIIRQIWDFWSQLSQCLNISAQTMIAGALGKNDMSTAREVLARILLFGIVPGGVLAALFMAGQTVLPAAFTTDAAVIAAVAHVVPLLAICMPLIPVATILEGALLGALDTGYIAKRTGVSLCLALGIIYGSQMAMHLGLIGVWIGMATFFAANTVMDTLRIVSPGSPLPVAAAVPDLD